MLYNNLYLLLEKMKEEAFGVNLQGFKSLVHKKIRFKKGVVPETIFQLFQNSEYHSAIRSEVLEQFARPHYAEILRELICDIKMHQEDKARRFAQQSLKWLSEKGWMKGQDLLKFSECLLSGQLNQLQEIMKNYGFQERYSDQFDTIFTQLQKTQSDMLKKSIKAIFYSFLKKEAENDRLIRKSFVVPNFIKNISQFEIQCSSLKIYYKQNSLEMIYEAVQRIGLGSEKVLKLVKQSTFPAFEQNFISLLAKTPSFHLNIKILLNLAALYIFFDLNYFLNEQCISSFIRSYFQNHLIYEQTAQRIGIEEDDQQNFQSINTTLNIYVQAFKYEKVKSIMIEEIEIYDKLMVLLFRVKKEMTNIELSVKQEIIEQIFMAGSDISVRNRDLNDLLEAVRGFFMEISINKLQNTVQEYKRIINLFFLADFGVKSFDQIKAAFNKDRDPSLKLNNIIPYDKLSDLSIPFGGLSTGSMEFNSDFNLEIDSEDGFSQRPYKQNLKVEYKQNASQSGICKSQKNFKQTLSLKKNVGSQDTLVKEASRISGQENEKMKHSNDENLCFIIIAIPQRSCKKVFLERFDHHQKHELEHKKISDGQFYFGSMTLKQNQINEYKVSFLSKKKEQSSSKSFFKSRASETYSASLSLGNEIDGEPTIREKCGIWLINKHKEDSHLLNKVIMKALQLLSEQLLLKKVHILSQQQINLVSLLAQTSDLKNESEKSLTCLLEESKMRFEENPLTTVLFIYFIYSIFRCKAYHILKQCKIIIRMTFFQNGSSYFTEQFQECERLRALYIKLFLKKLIIKPVKSHAVVLTVLRDNLGLRAGHMTVKTLQWMGKLYPLVLGELNHEIFQYMIEQKDYDVYDLIVVKLKFMRLQLQKKDPQVKYQFFKDFLDEVKAFSVKNSKKPQQQKLKILKMLVQQIELVLIHQSLFFSRTICLDNLMLIELYKRSKILSNSQRDIAHLFISKLFPHINCISNEEYLVEKIKVFLTKPQSQNQFDALQKYFRRQSIPLPVFKALVDFQMDHFNEQTYLLEVLNFLFVDYIINNKDFLSFSTAWIEEMLVFLDKKYIWLKENSKKMNEISVQFKVNEQKSLNLDHKVRLIIKRVGMTLSQIAFSSQKEKERKLKILLKTSLQLKEPSFHTMFRQQLFNSFSISEEQLDLQSDLSQSLYGDRQICNSFNLKRNE